MLAQEALEDRVDRGATSERAELDDLRGILDRRAGQRPAVSRPTRAALAARETKCLTTGYPGRSRESVTRASRGLAAGALALRARRRTATGRVAYVLDAFRTLGREPGRGARLVCWVAVSAAGRIAAAAAVAAALGIGRPLQPRHHQGRVAVGRMRGISAASCAASMLCEQLLTVSSAVLFMASGYLLAPADFGPLERYLPAAPWVAAFLLAAAITPMVLGTVANRVGRWMPGRLRPALLELRNLGLPHILGFVAVCCGVFVILGVTVARVAEAVAGAPVLPIAAAAVGFAAAWVLGLITPGAPGGMGVREAILVVCFAPLVGDGEAFTIALALRLVSILGDGTAFLIGFAGDRLLRRRRALSEQ